MKKGIVRRTRIGGRWRGIEGRDVKQYRIRRNLLMPQFHIKHYNLFRESLFM